MHAGNVKGTFCLHCLCFRVYKKPPVFRGLKFSFISFFCALLFRPYLSKQVWILKHKPCRWWTVSRGLQKSPLETFVRGFAAPPCSTPVPMPQKKTPKKLCAFWGFISVPVVDGLPRASKVSTGDFCARLCRAALFDPRAHVTKEKPQKALRLLGFYISAGGGGRTHTVSPPTDFESVSSANSNTPAHMLLV